MHWVGVNYTKNSGNIKFGVWVKDALKRLKFYSLNSKTIIYICVLEIFLLKI